MIHLRGAPRPHVGAGGPPGHGDRGAALRRSRGWLERASGQRGRLAALRRLPGRWASAPVHGGRCAALRRSRWRRGAAEQARRSGERGQASVELVALLPLALLVGFAIMALLAARAASGQAAAAAQAGAMALLQDAEPREAARAALPSEVRSRATIRVEAGRVTVTVRPTSRVAFLGDALTATVSADAGPGAR